MTQSDRQIIASLKLELVKTILDFQKNSDTKPKHIIKALSDLQNDELRELFEDETENPPMPK